MKEVYNVSGSGMNPNIKNNLVTRTLNSHKFNLSEFSRLLQKREVKDLLGHKFCKVSRLLKDTKDQYQRGNYLSSRNSFDELLKILFQSIHCYKVKRFPNACYMIKDHVSVKSKSSDLPKTIEDKVKKIRELKEGIENKKIISTQHLGMIEKNIWEASKIRNYISHDEFSSPKVWIDKYEKQVNDMTTVSSFSLKKFFIQNNFHAIKSSILEKKQDVEKIRKLEKEIIGETSRLYESDKLKRRN